MDPSRLIHGLVTKQEFIPELTLKQICRQVKVSLLEENTVVPVWCHKAHVVIAGDIHGQFYDLLELFKRAGEDIDNIHKNLNNQYVFLGDYVDRGYNSVETFQLLILLKLKYRSQITLLRGNHESRQITQVYGFFDECVRKYGNANVWRYCVELFDYLCIAATVEDKIFCVHGGLAPDLKLIDQIRTIQRVCEIPHEGAFGDLVWSDPDAGVTGWQRNPRGAGWVFGAEPARDWNHLNGVDIIARAHQLVQEGFRYMFERNVFSSSNGGTTIAHQPGRDHFPDNFGFIADSRHQQSSSGAASSMFTFGMDETAVVEYHNMHSSEEQLQGEADNDFGFGNSASTSPQRRYLYNEHVEDGAAASSGGSLFSTTGGSSTHSDDPFSFDNDVNQFGTGRKSANFEDSDPFLLQTGFGSGGSRDPSNRFGITSENSSSPRRPGKRKNHQINSSHHQNFDVTKDYDLVTVWSAPNYCYRCGNVASILMINEKRERRFEIFLEVEQSAKATPPRNLVPYFI
ncbi:unnamed protein product [Amoebophrya sp. A120]|nr:unnamed protein product [Amoebophrya sp. A120]|eukprot:GSA120T00015718001.1